MKRYTCHGLPGEYGMELDEDGAWVEFEHADMFQKLSEQFLESSNKWSHACKDWKTRAQHAERMVEKLTAKLAKKS